MQRVSQDVGAALRGAADNFNEACRDLEAWQVACGAVLGYVVAQKIRNVLFQEMPLTERVKTAVFHLARKVPYVRNQIQAAVVDSKKGFEESFWVEAHSPIVPTFPEKPMDLEKIMEHMTTIRDADDFECRRAEGRVSGTIYVGGQGYEEYTEMLTKVYGIFAWTNPLHASVFPGVRQMEAEIVAWCCSIFNGGPESCGVMTSGGTESIIMALKAYRDRAATEKGISEPNLVMPRTAHPAFEKGCQYFKIHVRKVDVDPITLRVDPRNMRRAMDSNTIAIVGSCVQYPHGVADPIEELSQLALQKGVGLHVDCCLGSFVVPFMRKAGYSFIDFDFTLPGVTSISADTHKYGYAPKGSSVLMYSSKELRHYQYSIFTDWPGGVYGTPGMAGSRPGALIAMTWAALASHGIDGYIKNTKLIVETARYIARGISEIKGLRLMGEPDAMVVAWTSDVFHIHRLQKPLCKESGWDLNMLQFPSSIHLAVTMAHTKPGIADAFLRDLAAATEPLVETPDVDRVDGGTMYGASQAIPDRTIIKDVVSAYIDVTYQSKPEILTQGNGKSKSE